MLVYGEVLYEFGNAFVTGFVSADDVLANAAGRSGTVGGIEDAAGADAGAVPMVFVAAGDDTEVGTAAAAAAAAVPRSHGFGGEGMDDYLKA